MMQTWESSVCLPQEVHTWERRCCSSLMVCLNIKGVALDILLTAHCHWHAHKYYMGSKRLQPRWRWSGGKGCFECGLMRSLTGGAGTDGVQGVWTSFMVFLQLFSHSKWREDDVSLMPEVPCGECLRQLLVLPLSAVHFLYVLTRIKDRSPRPRGEKCVLKSVKEKQKENN